MKNIKRNILIIIGFCVFMLLAGCSSVRPLSVDTTLSVDRNFRGERVMTAVMSQREFDALFDGDIEGLNQMLTQNAPADLDARAQQMDGGEVEIALSIPFASYDEYYNKIMAIFSGSSSYDAENMPSVYFEYSDSLLKKGFIIEENFTSTELFF